MPVRWDESLSVGNPEIDAQHQEMFSRARALAAAMAEGKDPEIAVLFDYLAEHVRAHFVVEERLMDVSAFPGAGVHRAAHERFAREYEELRRLYEANGPTRGIAVKTRTWLDGWLRSHIAGLDHPLAVHLRARAG